MAVALVSQPSDNGTFYYLNECLEYKLVLTDLGNDPETKKLIYKVCADDESGNAIELTKEKHIKPLSTSQEIVFQINENIKDAFDNPIPLLDGNNSPQAWTGYRRKAYIKYGELIINNETGTTEGDAFNLSEKRDVVNGYEQAYLNPTRLGTHPMTDCKNHKITDDSHDWILIYSALGGSQLMTITENDETETTQNVTLAAGGNLVPVGGANANLGSLLARNVKSVAIMGRTTYYEHSYPGKDKRIDIYFQEAQGSWRCMNFKRQGSEEVSRDFTEICKNNGCTTSVSDLVKSHGRSILHKRSWLNFEATKQVFVTKNNIESFRSFANARQYRAAVKHSDHSTILFPVIPDIRSLPTWNQSRRTEIVFRGSIGIDMRT